MSAALSLALALLPAVPAPATEAPPEVTQTWFQRGDKGLELRSADGNWFANVDLRAQFRYTGSEIDDRPPAEGARYSEDRGELNRARLKIGGHAGRPWIDYYFEHDLVDSRVLDLRLTLETREELQLRVGQWKIPFNRERIDSSGNQQFVDRSIATPAFTLDRQRGLAVFGHLWADSGADAWYHVGLYEPLGRDGRGDYADPLLLARWQWNVLGRELGFSQGDLGYREHPAASLALAAARYRGPYTAFSSSGGGQLPGFAEGGPERYAVEQFLLETAWQYRGLSWQQEWHRKQVRDTETGRTTTLEGGYVQGGAFPHAWWAAVPRPLEVALRYALVDPDRRRADDQRTETLVAVNWFLRGHRHKLTADYGRLDDPAATGGREERRLRLQWDVSL